MSKQEIDARYLSQANQLEKDFFNIINEGLPDQHRELKAGKDINDFNSQHGAIWRNHEQELIANGYLEPPETPVPVRDLAAELDELKTRVANIESLAK